jgi:hypothetical protein
MTNTVSVNRSVLFTIMIVFILATLFAVAQQFVFKRMPPRVLCPRMPMLKAGTECDSEVLVDEDGYEFVMESSEWKLLVVQTDQRSERIKSVHKSFAGAPGWRVWTVDVGANSGTLAEPPGEPKELILMYTRGGIDVSIEAVGNISEQQLVEVANTFEAVRGRVREPFTVEGRICLRIDELGSGYRYASLPSNGFNQIGYLATRGFRCIHPSWTSVAGHTFGALTSPTASMKRI